MQTTKFATDPADSGGVPATGREEDQEITMKLPLFIKAARHDNGREMTKAEALRIIRSVYGEKAKVVQASGLDHKTGNVVKEWRAIV